MRVPVDAIVMQLAGEYFKMSMKIKNAWDEWSSFDVSYFWRFVTKTNHKVTVKHKRVNKDCIEYEVPNWRALYVLGTLQAFTVIELGCVYQWSFLENVVH
jgi:hypothetical protein